ncbi:mechanosensitive ion channel family protein [Mollicutes bacterium LVI A0039]|nr:mechanosensitive ion channel family protein [Mollicutes bacterium LVI A0039]
MWKILTEVEGQSEATQWFSTDAFTDFFMNIDPALLVYHIIKYIGTVGLTVFGFWVLTKILIRMNHRLSRKLLKAISDKRRETILVMVDNLIKYVMGAISVFAVLIALGFDQTTLLASAGAASIIIGLAAKELITDFINGFFTVVEGYYDVGDYIVVNGHTGVVEKLGIKATVLRTDQGEQVTIPNSLIEEIINYNRGEHHLFLTISTAYEESIDRAQDVIINKLLPRIVERSSATAAIYMGVAKLNSSSVDHRIKVTCSPDDRFQVERDTYTETKRLFDQEKMEIPYTKLTIVSED